jgi:hypothetical protein
VKNRKSHKGNRSYKIEIIGVKILIEEVREKKKKPLAVFESRVEKTKCCPWIWGQIEKQISNPTTQGKSTSTSARGLKVKGKIANVHIIYIQKERRETAGYRALVEKCMKSSQLWQDINPEIQKAKPKARGYTQRNLAKTHHNWTSGGKSPSVSSVI